MRLFSGFVACLLGAVWGLAGAVQAQAAPVYPAQPYSSPPVERPGYLELQHACFLTGGDAVERAQRFAHNTLRQAAIDGQYWAHWQVTSLPEQEVETGIYFVETILREPEAISFEVRNAGPEPVQFGVFLHESQWLPEHPIPTQSWYLPQAESVAPGEHTVLTFSLADREALGDTGRQELLFPLNAGLRVMNPENHEQLDLYLRDWAIHYGVARDVEVTRFAASGHPRAGEAMTAAFAIDGDVAGREVSLELWWRGRVLWRAMLDKEDVALLHAEKVFQHKMTLPWYLPGEEVTLGLVVDGYRVDGEVATLEVVQEREPALPQVERRMHQGRPTVFVDDAPFPWIYYASYAYTPGNVAEFGASGANVFVPPTVAGSHIHDVAAPTWLPDGSYDFSQIDERVAMALQANPDAHVILRLFLGVPNGWLEKNPEVVGRVRSGEVEVDWDTTGATAFSIASPTWQEKQEELLRETLRYCAGQPWAERVLGFMLVSGVTEEWFGWAAIEAMSKPYYSDYGVENEAAFLAWCAAQGLDVDGLPEPEARQGANRDIFPDTPEGRAAAAYARFNSVATAEAINRFARAAKEETGGRSLTGTLYGYVMQLTGEPRQHMAGNFALREVLDNPDLDFLMGIPLHNFRDLTNGYDLYVSATESILEAGKFFVNENDLFSWLHHAHWYKEYIPEDPRKGAIRMHRRVLGNDMVHGTQRGWFSLLANWHHDAGLQAEFARQIQWHRDSFDFDRSGVEEVAFLVDDTSFGWYTPGSPLPREANVDMLYAFGRTGAPVGVWLLSDIDRLPERIRFVVVAHAPAASAESIQKLEAAIAEGERTFFLQGPVGLVDGDSGAWDREAPARITGLPVTVEDEAGPAGVMLTTSDEALYPDAERNPRTVVSNDVAIGTYSDGVGAVAWRPLANGGQLYWSGAPMLNNGVARRLLEEAGVHLYAPENFTIHASRDLISITAPNAQTASLTFPDPVQVRDWFTDWQGAGDVFDCPFEDGQTRFFEIRREP